MQASVVGQVRWRLELYRKSFDLCRAGGFSLARFLALVPDRLRLATGDALSRVKVPFAIDEGVVAAWRRGLPGRGTVRVDRPLVESGVDVRRALRIAQVDADADVVDAGLWILERSMEMLSAGATLYALGLGEVGRGEGEETAYLVHLLILESMRRALDTGGPADPQRASLAAGLLDLALEGAAASGKIDPKALSARLGFQIAITTSPLAFGVTADELARRPLGAYRTTPEAFALARRVVQDPVEVIDLDRVTAVLAERVLADPNAKASLARDILGELVRDALMLLTLQGYGPDPDERIKALRALTAQGAALFQHVSNAARRERLAGWLAPYAESGSKPALAVTGLLAKAEQIIRGDARPLGTHGNLDERARLAAQGAVLLVLDERADRWRKEMSGVFHEIEPHLQEDLHKKGRCYRIGLDRRPLYFLSKSENEAALHADLRELAARARSLPTKEAADEHLRATVHRPAIAVASRFAGPTGDAVRMVRCAPNALSFTGDVVSIVGLGFALRRILDTARESGPVGEILGGNPTALQEIDEEIARADERLSIVEGTLKRLPKGDESARYLVDARAMHVEELARLRESRRAVVERVSGKRPEAGVFIAYGPPSAAADLSGGLHPPAITGPALDEAERGADRSQRIGAARSDLLERARTGQGDARLVFGFEVDARRGRWLELPEDVADAIDDAVKKRRLEAVEPITGAFRDWLSAKIDDATGEPTSPPPLEIYNAGFAISQAALDAYTRERRAVLAFDEVSFSVASLPDELRARMVFERDLERFLFARRPDTGDPVVIFRHAAEGVWELLDAESPLGRGLASAARGAA